MSDNATLSVNLEQIKKISKVLLIGELIEKTKKCAVTWDKISAGQYRCKMLPLEFYLSKMGQDLYSLDIQKNSSFYRTYNSYIQTEVRDLFETVENFSKENFNLEKIKSTMSAVGKIEGCTKFKVKNITGYGGVKVEGASFYYTGITLVPSAVMSSGMTSGTYLNIRDKVDANDGDTTKIIVNYTGIQNPNYMLVKVQFDNSQIPLTGSYNMIRCRVVCKSDNIDDINMVLDYSVNDINTPSGLGYAGFPDIDGNYAILDSGFSNLPTTMSYSNFLSPLVLWFYIVPVGLGSGEIQITSADITLARN